MFGHIPATLGLMITIASGPTYGPVQADVISVYDGDTITVRAFIWPGLTVDTSVRIRGIDTPEIRGACEKEKADAIAARDFLRRQILDNDQVQLYQIVPDKYGKRVVADVTIAGSLNVADMMLSNGYARPYDGSARRSWCD